MSVEHLKSKPITNLDGPINTPPTPVIPNTAGEGAAQQLNEIDGYVTISAAASAGSTYQILRVPSSVKIKSVFLESEAQGAGKVNVSVYYSDSPVDGTSVANQGTIVPQTNSVGGGDQFFASDVDLSSAVATDVTNENGTYDLSKRVLPLWQALALASDPGGYFDLVLVVHTTAITTGTGKAGLRVNYAA